jgi:uncharacterized membrane protein YoaK (UPF0700 family)
MEPNLSMKNKFYQVEIPQVDRSIWLSMVPFVLSLIAGCSDTISFLGLDGLFTAHITGNLVLLAAHVVAGSQVPISQIIAVPVFFLMLVLIKSIANGLERLGITTLHPLLTLQFVLLACSFLAGIFTHNGSNPNTISQILTGMFGVSAMAVQNAVVQTSLIGAPTTAVMTTNVTRFTIDVGEMLMGYDPEKIKQARSRAINTWPAIVGFFIGCVLGAAGEAFMGLWALIIPTGFALISLLLSLIG